MRHALPPSFSDASHEDDPARDKAILDNLALVKSVAKMYIRKIRVLSFDDLVQEGVIGLMRAYDLYDPSRGTLFSTYAYQWMRQRIARLVQSKENPIHVPMHVLMYESQARKGEELPSHAIEKLEAKKRVSQVTHFVEWNSPTEGRQTADSDEVEKLLKHLGKIRPRDRHVIKLHFGIDCEPMTYHEIGQELGITRERVRQLCARGLDSLARLFKDEGETMSESTLARAKEASR